MKGRYTSEIQIRNDIDKWQNKARALLESAEALELIAKQWMKDSPAMNESARYNQKQADRKRRSSARIEHRKLARLKEKLSEFLTPPLPGCGINDQSIQK